MANTIWAARTKWNSTKLFYSMCLDTQDNSFGSMPFKYFPFACTVPVLVFFAFLPEISAMVTSAVNITKPLKRIYPQIQFFLKIVVVVVVSMSFSTCSQKFPRAQKSVQKHFGLVFNYFPLLLSRCLFSWESSRFCRKCYRRGTFSTLFTIQRRERLNKASKIKGEAEMVERYINYNFLFKLFFSSTLSHSSSHTLNESILSWHIVIYNAYPEYVVSNCCDV